MKCPFCGVNEDKVLETRTLNDGTAIKRRRECEACSRRFTTLEEIEELQVFVIKSDNRREAFDRSKIVRGMQVACKGRKNISVETLDAAAQDIERSVYNRLEKEISSREVGDMVMDRLKRMDSVAFVRFASVYLQFEDATEFREIIKALNRRTGKTAT